MLDIDIDGDTHDDRKEVPPDCARPRALRDMAPTWWSMDASFAAAADAFDARHTQRRARAERLTTSLVARPPTSTVFAEAFDGAVFALRSNCFVPPSGPLGVRVAEASVAETAAGGGGGGAGGGGRRSRPWASKASKASKAKSETAEGAAAAQWTLRASIWAGRATWCDGKVCIVPLRTHWLARDTFVCARARAHVRGAPGASIYVASV